MTPPPSPSAAPVLTSHEGGRTVVLRGHRPEDAQGCLEQCQDPLTQRWTTVPVPYTREMAEDFVGRVMPAGWADGSEWGFVVEVDGRYAGSASLRPEGSDRAEVAYAAHPWVRGTGAVEQALRVLLDWGFEQQGLRTVVWWAERGNWASRKTAWRLGFEVDGSLRAWLPQRGELHDAWVGTLRSTDPRRPRTRWLEVPTLEADGLLLRPWRDTDVARVVEACSDPESQRWLGQLPAPYTDRDARAWLEDVTERLATGGAVNWAVVDPGAPDRALASVGWFALTPYVTCEIGYWTHPDARGTGVATRALRAVARHAFDDLMVRRVSCAAATGNTASRRVIEQAGFTAYGVERLGALVRDGRADLVLYDRLDTGA